MPEENNPPDPLLAIVVPVRNEVDNVVPLIEEIMAAMQGVCKFEIIYVDDGSTDGTVDILTQTAVGNTRLRVLAHRQNYGQSAAICSGVDAARAPLIATLDGDGQNDPADIPALLRAYNDGLGDTQMMISGLRAKRRDSWIKRVSSKIANGVRASLLGDNTPDTGCGLKVFSRAAFIDLPRFDHMHRFLPALMIRNGGKVTSVPVNHRPRQRGTSKYGTLDRLFVGISDMIGVMWLQRRIKRPVVDEVSPK